MEQSLLQMKQRTRWSISWGDSSRLYLPIFSHHYFPTCNRSNSSSYSPFYRHRFFDAARSGLALFLDISSLLLSANFFVFGYFSGWVICECIARLEELEVVTVHGFSVEFVYCHVLKICFWDVLQQRCNRNGEICCPLGWICAASVLVMRSLYFWMTLLSALLWFQFIILSFYLPIFLLQTFEIYKLCVKAIELTSLHTSCIEFVWTSKRWSSERASTLCVATRVCYSILCVCVCVWER